MQNGDMRSIWCTGNRIRCCKFYRPLCVVRPISRIAEYVAPGGGYLLLIARARESGESEGNMPWPLTRAEVEEFQKEGLTEVYFEDYLDRESPPIRRFRACYKRLNFSEITSSPTGKLRLSRRHGHVLKQIRPALGLATLPSILVVGVANDQRQRQSRFGINHLLIHCIDLAPGAGFFQSPSLLKRCIPHIWRL